MNYSRILSIYLKYLNIIENYLIGLILKSLPFKIPKFHRDGLIYQEDQELVFYDQLHQHEEIQISYLVEGSGTLIVADSVVAYGPGDVLVIGTNVPHVFRSNKNADHPSYMKTLFFEHSAFGAGFFELEETKSLEPFFKRARTGMLLQGAQDTFNNWFQPLAKASKFQRFVTLLKILDYLSKAGFKPLSSTPYTIQLSSKEGQRLRHVFEFTMTNYHRDLNLESISEVANMTKTAFCKYFKKRTNTTYNQFLNAYRVEQVVKDMQRFPERSISEIAYDNGFGSVSNFNKTFRLIKGCTPLQMRRNGVVE